MQIRFADIPYLFPEMITEDPLIDDPNVLAWRILLDQEFLRACEPIMDLSWVPMGSWGTIATEYTEEGAEYTFPSRQAAEHFVERVNELLRGSMHGWRGGDPARED